MSESFKLNPGQERARRDVLTSGARYCLLYGGSRSGKTVVFTHAIEERGWFAPKSKHLFVRQEASAARASLARGNMATIPAVSRMAFDDRAAPEWNEQYGYFTLANGSELWVGGLNDEKAMERILGNEYATIYCNEASEIGYNAFLMLRSRLAQNVDTIDGGKLSQRLYVDLNPTTRQHWTYRLWIDGIDPQDEKSVDPAQYAYCVVNPMENAENLSGDYIADLEAMPEKQKRRFFLGEYTEDVENALWRREMIRRVEKTPDLRRIVVAVDPAASAEVGSDETGIVAAGVDAGNVGYVLDDDSGRYKPEQWARKAIALYDFHSADRIVAEKNMGGDMVEHTIRAHRPDVPVTLVTATRGKVVRAEPVAALYERNKVFHAGVFDDLEGQMCAFTSHFDRKSAGYSPDRVDALVWAFTDLFPQMTRRSAAATGPIRRPVGTMA